MNGILMSLMMARNGHQLVNIFQRSTPDYYTGYVEVLGPTHVIVRTFNDAGLPDGAALIAFAAIEMVEVSGDDLEDMQFRMAVATHNEFLTAPGVNAPLQFDAKKPLIHQLALQAQHSQAMLLVMQLDDEAVLEGQVTAVDEDRLTLNVFNKFNYTDVRSIQVDYDTVAVIEFQGLELLLEQRLVAHRDAMFHVPTVITYDAAEFPFSMDAGMESGMLVAAVPYGEADQFYVGTVKAVNDTTAVLRLKDMAGQFGGYVILRLNALRSITRASDYLQTVRAYGDFVTEDHIEKQPVLNADREFDAGTDLFATLVGEAATFERVIRVRDGGDGAYWMGTPRGVTATGFDLKLADGRLEHLALADVSELAFGHVYAYLQEQRMRRLQ